MTQSKLNFRWVFICIFSFLGVTSYAQTQTVSGMVTDSENGEPLIGVTIIAVENPSIGTVTDYDGKFSVDIPTEYQQLQISYVGYQTITKNVTDDFSNIQMNSGELLDEVVVVGYGTQKTKEVTSAITNVKSEDFNKGNITDAAQLLQGKVAGLSIAKPGGDPNSGYNIRLRGLSTFGGNTAPLFIVDGVIVDNFDSVDPNDVASVSVLKDASAAAIYGTRASNGVILMTTKQGSKENAGVEYRGQVSIENAAKFPNVLTADEYKSIPRSVDFGNETNWFEEITRQALTHTHNLSLSGATDQSNYRVSLNYRNGEGVALNSGYNQLNGRVNFTQKALNDKLRFDAVLSSTTRNEDNPLYEAFGFATVYNPTASVKTDSVEWAEWGGYFQRDAFNFYNPVAVLEQNIRTAKKINNLWKGKVSYELIEGLTYDLSYAQTSRSELYNEYFSKKSFWSPKASGSHKGFAGKYTNDYKKDLFETTLNYNKKFDKLNTKFLGGYSYQEELYEEFGMSAGGFLTDGFSYNNIKSASDFEDGKAQINSAKNKKKLIAFFGRANFSFDDTYFLTATVRREGSTMFGENNKWGVFPGVSGGVNITNLVKIPMVDRLKLRAGYGVTGNLPPDPYLSKLLFKKQGSYYNAGKFEQAYGPDRNANPDLKWESKKDLNIGFDLNMLDYKLNFGFDYYKANVSDLILEFNVRVPPNPFPTKFINLGELQSSGMDLALGLTDIDIKGIKWSSDFTFSKFFESKIVKITSDEVLAESSRLISDLGTPNLIGIKVIQFEEGSQVGQIVGPVFEGIDENGKMTFKDIDGDGKFNAKKDITVLGNGLPDYQMGFNNTFRYQNFDLGFFFRGVFGHDLVNVNNAKFGAPNAIAVQSGMSQALDYIDAKDGPAFSSVHVEDASYVKLDNISLGYTFTNLKNSKRSLRVFIAGQNLMTFTNYSGVDPEVRYSDSDGGALAPGIDRENTYISTKSFTFGVSFGL